MQAHTTLVIVGAGGHGRVVADAALAQGAWPRVVATDADPAKCGGELLPGVGLLPYREATGIAGAQMHIAIGSWRARDNEVRALGEERLARVVHPKASVSQFAELAPGVFVAAQAVVAPHARIGATTIVNHNAVVDHDCVVGAYTHIAPHAALGGGASVGARVLLGSGARLLPGVSICDDVVVGAGAIVTESIRQPGVYVGVPARRVK